MKHQAVFNRLRRIEGQIRGIEEMVNSDRLERDILIQLEAVKSSMASTISSLIESMLKMGEADNVTLSEADVATLLRIVKKI